MKFLFYLLHVLCVFVILVVILATVLGEGSPLMWAAAFLMISNLLGVRTIKKQNEVLEECFKHSGELYAYHLSVVEKLREKEDNHE